MNQNKQYLFIRPTSVHVLSENKIKYIYSQNIENKIKKCNKPLTFPWNHTASRNDRPMCPLREPYKDDFRSSTFTVVDAYTKWVHG